MADSTTKAFDCAQSMRQIRDQLSAEIDGMRFEALTHWLRSHAYTDPLLGRLARRASQQIPAREESDASLDAAQSG